MRYVKQYYQETVKEKDPAIFDAKVNEIYRKAYAGGKDPEVKFIDGLGLCASIRYFVSEQIPESIRDEYELRGEKHYCCECPYFVLPEDRRIRRVLCERKNRTDASSGACDIFYEEVLNASSN